MDWRVSVTGSHFARRFEPVETNEPAKAARILIKQIGARDQLHADEAARALEFWTEEQINEDLNGPAGLCDILVNGGFYTIEIRRV